MSAAHFGLTNLCVIIDNNGLQIDGSVADVMSVYPIDEKVKAFGFEVVEIDGHSFEEIEKAFAHIKTVTDKPSCIIMRTVKGKGVSFLENTVASHYWHVSKEDLEAGCRELEV